MKINVKYFAGLRELMGEAETWIEVGENVSVNHLWERVTADKGIVFNTVIMTVNMEYVKPTHQLKVGDEVAFFPPVTGG